jgi:hypothetical protein
MLIKINATTTHFMILLFLYKRIQLKQTVKKIVAFWRRHKKRSSLFVAFERQIIDMISPIVTLKKESEDFTFRVLTA